MLQHPCEHPKKCLQHRRNNLRTSIRNIGATTRSNISKFYYSIKEMLQALARIAYHPLCINIGGALRYPLDVAARYPFA